MNGAAEISLEKRGLKMSKLGDCNALPRFGFQSRKMTIKVDKNVREAASKGLITDYYRGPLPHLMQDEYDRSQADGEIDCVRMENEYLRVLFYPTVGGRMISMFDKEKGRELLYDNPVFQPCNVALRNAWVSGGVEWNGLRLGHTVYTCDSVYMGKVEVDGGVMVRIYEFDRYRECTWQVDVFLGDDAKRLYVHGRIMNPNDNDVDMWWWSNIAVGYSEDTRVLSPTGNVIVYGTHEAPMPDFDGYDSSYPYRYPHSSEIFFTGREGMRRWIASVNGDGEGMIQTSTGELVGRKLFCWGEGVVGRNWMDLLSMPGEGAYVEIQAGITATQMQTRPLCAGEDLQWTECYCAFDMDDEVAHQADYHAAVEVADGLLNELVLVEEVEKMDDFMKGKAEDEISEMLWRGSKWGDFEEELRGERLAKGLVFDAEVDDETRACAELVEKGTFSDETLSREPGGWVLSERWVVKLRESMEEYGATWLHWVLLGVAALERCKWEEGKKCFERSVELRDNFQAYRGLALAKEKLNDIEGAKVDYLKAWELSDEYPHLALEVSSFLQKHKFNDELSALIEGMSEETRRHERVAIVVAQWSLAKGDADEAMRIITEVDFATIREGERTLSQIWFGAHELKKKEELRRELTKAEIAGVRENNPMPNHINFS